MDRKAKLEIAKIWFDAASERAIRYLERIRTSTDESSRSYFRMARSEQLAKKRYFANKIKLLKSGKNVAFTSLFG